MHSCNGAVTIPVLQVANGAWKYQRAEVQRSSMQPLQESGSLVSGLLVPSGQGAPKQPLHLSAFMLGVHLVYKRTHGSLHPPLAHDMAA